MPVPPAPAPGQNPAPAAPATPASAPPAAPTSVPPAAPTKSAPAAAPAPKKKFEVPPFVYPALKYTSSALAAIALTLFGWTTVDADPANSYLQNIGIAENTGQKFDSLERKKKALDAEVSKLSSEIAKFSSKIEREDYYRFTSVIEQIKSERYVWFDQINEEGETEFGLLDAFDRMEEYFGSEFYQHPILSKNQIAENEIKISEVSANRENVSFSVVGSNLFGKVFFLGAEFVDLANSFPLFKGGSIQDFARKEADDGDTEINFSLRLQIQNEKDVDPLDQKFDSYKAFLDQKSEMKAAAPKKRRAGPSIRN